MKQKIVYLAVYGQNQLPFNSLDAMKEYFQNSGNLFEAIMNEVKFYELVVKPIDSPLNNKSNG